MTRKLKRIAPLQLGKMLGVLYALMGLIFLPLFLVFAAIGAFAQNGSQPSQETAALYNVIARWIGGIEVEVE